LRSDLFTLFLYFIFGATAFWISTDEQQFIKIEPPKNCCFDSYSFLRAEVFVTMAVVPFIAWFFTIFIKESEIKNEAKLTEQLMGALLSFIVDYGFYLTYGLLVSFLVNFVAGDICPSQVEYITSFSGFNELYASFYVLLYKSMHPLSIPTNWIALISIITVLYFLNVVVRAIFAIRAIKILGFVLFVTSLIYKSSPLKRDEALLVYIFFHILDELVQVIVKMYIPKEPVVART